ncbi:MAG TPA: 2-phospho-L-lactate transferase [Micropepsaceae bacterium]|nr:2-phospho-L-lactate transferase [Micropepsaceae bacterium]
MKIVALAGGVGGAKLGLGLYRAMDAADLTFVVNTGDDVVMHGLHVSPDPDILMYTLAGVVNEETGWGIKGETFHVAEGLKRYGRPTWFNLGDSDLATHIHRTALMRDGSLSQAIDSIRQALEVRAHILPMTDNFVPTLLDTDEGRMHLQDYLVRRRCEPKLFGIIFDGIERARPAPGVLAAIAEADGIVVCPSNPLISIGPILAVPGIRDALLRRRANVIAVCPLVGGKSLKGPSDKMMAELGYDVSATGVATLYRDICGTMIIDRADESACGAIRALGIEPVIRSTVMKTVEDKERLAREVHSLFTTNRP